MGKLTFLSVLGLTLSVIPCSATTIQLGINGDAQVGTNYLDFGQYPNGAPYAPAPGYGTFEVSLVNPGIFQTAGVTNGEFGTIQSLNEPPGNVTLPGPFMTFDTGGSNLQLWLTTLPAGNFGPFMLTDTANGAVASFNADGYITQGGVKVETFSGTFSETFNGTSAAQLLTSLPINTPFTGTFSAVANPVVPEPASLLLLASGLIAIGGLSRRKRSKV